MKGGSKFLVFSRCWALYKQRHYAYCFWAIIFIMSAILCFVAASLLHFETSYGIVIALAATLVTMGMFDHLFFAEVIIVSKQLHWLEKYREDYFSKSATNEEREEDLRDLNGVIDELSKRMQVLSIG